MSSKTPTVEDRPESVLETTEELPPELLKLIRGLKNGIIEPTPEVLEHAARLVRRERAKRLGHPSGI